MSNATDMQRLKRQQEEQRTTQAENAGLEQATRAAALDQGGTTNNASFMREYGRADIRPQPGDRGTVREHIAGHLSHHNLYSNITEDEHERLKTLNRALPMIVKAEFPRRSGVSSKCVGRYREELLGEDKPVLTPDMEREIDAALGDEGVRTMMQWQSVDASAWRGITQIQSVVSRVDDAATDAADGLVGKAKKFLGGGS